MGITHLKIEMDLQEIRRESVGRVNVDQDTYKWPALMNKAMQLRILQNSQYFWISCEAIGYSSRKMLHGVRSEDWGYEGMDWVDWRVTQPQKICLISWVALLYGMHLLTFGRKKRTGYLHGHEI